MAVSQNDRWIQAVATSSQTVFNYDFIINSNSEIAITKNSTLLNYGTDYTLTGVGVTGGGTFILNSGATAGDIYTAYGVTPEARNSDFSGKSAVTTDAINSQYDNLTEQTQQLRRDIGRAILVPIYDDISGDNLILPSVDERKDKFAYFDDNGDIIAVEGTPASQAAGSNTQVQYNDNGTMAGDAGMTTNGSGVVSITGNLTVDNIRIDTNTISSTDTNGNIRLNPNGTGKVIINSTTGVDGIINDNTFATASQTTLATSASIKAYVDASPTGDVHGPTSSVDNTAVRFDGTTGKLIQGSSIVIDDSDAITGITSITIDNININGNTISSTDTNGNIILDPNGTGKVVINSSTGIDGVIDDSSFATASSTTIPTSASVKAYVDASPSGNVVGPNSATDNAITRYDSTTGKLIQNSGVTLDDSNNIVGINNLTMADTKKIVDENNVGQIEFATVAPAANWLKINNQASGNAPKLSVNGSDTNISMQIQTKGTGDLKLSCNSILVDNGTNSGAGEIRLREITTNGSDYIGLKSPDSLSGSTTFVLPTGDGTAAQVLTTDGSKNLGWSSVVVSPGTSVDNTVTRFDGTSGAIQGSGIVIDDSNNITGIASLNINSTTTVSSIIDDNTFVTASSSNIPTAASVKSYVDAAPFGNVVGPASSTDNTLPRYDGTTGKLIQGSSVVVNDSNEISGLTQLNVGNIQVSGNSIYSTDTNGNIYLTPNGTGKVSIDGLSWPTSDGTTGQVLKTDGLGNLGWQNSSTGSVTGPGSSTDNAIVRFDGTGGSTVQNSGIIIDDSNNITGPKLITIGDNSSGPGEIRFNNTAGNHYVGLKAGTLSADKTWVLPTSDGTSGQALKTDGSANLGWSSFVSGPGTSTSNAIATYNDTTGNVLANNSITISGTTITASALSLRSTSASLLIKDSNNNNAVEIAGVASAVNNIEIQNSATGANPIILTEGSDANISLTLKTKGSAAVVVSNGTSGPGELRINNTNDTHYVGFKAGTLSADKTWVLPTSDGTSGQALITDGSGNLSFSSTIVSANVIGPVSSTDNALVRFDGTTGEVIQNSGITIDDSNNISGANSIIFANTKGIANSGANMLTFSGGSNTGYMDILCSNTVDPTLSAKGSGSNYSLNLSSKGTGNIGLTANAVTIGNGSTGPGEIRILEDSDNGSNFFSFKSPSNLDSDQTVILPNPYTAGNYFSSVVMADTGLDSTLNWRQLPLTLKAQATASSSSQLDFTAILSNSKSTVGLLIVLGELQITSSATFLIRCGTSGSFDTTSNYKWAYQQSTFITTPSPVNVGSAGASNIRIAPASGVTNTNISGHILVSRNFNSSGTTSFSGFITGEESNSGNMYATAYGVYQSSCTDLRFYPSTGTITSGIISVYTINGSTSYTL